MQSLPISQSRKTTPSPDLSQQSMWLPRHGSVQQFCSVYTEMQMSYNAWSLRMGAQRCEKGLGISARLNSSLDSSRRSFLQLYRIRARAGQLQQVRFSRYLYCSSIEHFFRASRIRPGYQKSEIGMIKSKEAIKNCLSRCSTDEIFCSFDGQLMEVRIYSCQSTVTFLRTVCSPTKAIFSLQSLYLWQYSSFDLLLLLQFCPTISKMYDWFL